MLRKLDKALDACRKRLNPEHIHKGEIATHAGYLTMVFVEGHSLYAYFAGVAVLVVVAQVILYGWSDPE